jgi:hypothetical protein
MGRPDFVDVSLNIRFHMTVTAEIKDDFSSPAYWYVHTVPQDVRNNIQLDVIKNLQGCGLCITQIDEFFIRWSGLGAEVIIGTKACVEDKIVYDFDAPENPFDLILLEALRKVKPYEFKESYITAVQNNIPTVKEIHMEYVTSVHGLAVDHKILEAV